MRISLLLEREPFPHILEQTLSRYWSDHFGQPITVRWQTGRPNGRIGQIWLVNAYLNTIFVPDVDAAVFDPIKREYSRSPVWWKRPLQQTYVHLAIHPRLAHRFTQAYLTVSPVLPEAAQTLVIPGNHKIRWLDMVRQTTVGIVKAGFDDHFFRQELKARQQAAAHGVPVPELLEAAPEAGWFSEQYVSGTPLNRLADRQQAEQALAEVSERMQSLLAATAVEIPAHTYITTLSAKILARIQTHHLLTAVEKETMAVQTEALAAQAVQQTTPITTALTHGDFQPANILLNENGVWLIDWEYAARRQISYDALVFGLNTRFPQGLAGRLQRYGDTGDLAHPVAALANWPGMGLDVFGRTNQITLFLMEELDLTLTELAQPPLTQTGSRLAEKQMTIAAFLMNNKSWIGNG